VDAEFAIAATHSAERGGSGIQVVAVSLSQARPTHSPLDNQAQQGKKDGFGILDDLVRNCLFLGPLHTEDDGGNEEGGQGGGGGIEVPACSGLS
jgi:hypothetical protein